MHMESPIKDESAEPTSQMANPDDASISKLNGSGCHAAGVKRRSANAEL